MKWKSRLFSRLIFTISLAGLVTGRYSGPNSPGTPTLASVVNATYDVRDFGVFTDDKASIAVHTVYRVAIFRVQFDRPFTVLRQHGSTAEKPDESDNQFGLTRLTCGRRIFDSHPRFSLPELRQDAAPVFLVPLSADKAAHPVARMVAALHASDLSPTEYAAMLILDEHQGDRPHGTAARPALADADVGRCTLRFLAEGDQNWRPAGRMLDAGGVEAFVTETPLTAASDSARAVDGTAGGGDVKQLPGLALQFLHDSSRRHSRFGGSTRPGSEEEVLLFPTAEEAAAAVNGTREKCIALSDESADQRVDPVAFVDTGLTAGMKLGSIMGLILPVVEGLVEPMTDVLGGAMVAGLTNDLSNDLGQVAGATLVADISSFLGHSLVSSLAGSLPPTLTKTLHAQLQSAVSERVMQVVSDEVAVDSHRKITEAVDEAVAQGVPRHLEETLGRAVARKLLISLGHTLSRSIAHALVPALAHTLTHNPMEDYYCYYCYHDKVYCQYCHYAPQQVYYALYYTGYYSTYYSDYYGRYYALRMDAARSAAHSPEPGGG